MIDFFLAHMYHRPQQDDKFYRNIYRRGAYCGRQHRISRVVCSAIGSRACHSFGEKRIYQIGEGAKYSVSHFILASLLWDQLYETHTCTWMLIERYDYLTTMLHCQITWISFIARCLCTRTRVIIVMATLAAACMYLMWLFTWLAQWHPLVIPQPIKGKDLKLPSAK